MMYFDVYYLYLVVPTILLSLIAQIMVKSTFSKYSKISLSSGLSGADVAARVLRDAGIDYVSIQQTSGFLSDHFNPRNKSLNLSQPVYSVSSISAAGVAAHEAGHAIQQKKRYLPLVLRSTLVPAANIGSKFGPYLAMFGIILQYGILIDIGIILFSAAVLFYLVTLPVEFNASSRAIKALRASGIMSQRELSGAKKVLTAAAMTYVASALSACASLLRLILISNRRRR